MQLVFLYGPPATGKLTVGRELAALTGFKLFHNHLTVDLVTALFSRGSPPFGPLVHRLRREMLAEAVRHNVNLIFTYVYARPDDEPDVRGLLEPVFDGRGTVRFVQRTCPRDELFARVANEERRAYLKITGPDRLSSLLDRFDLLSPVPSGRACVSTQPRSSLLKRLPKSSATIPYLSSCPNSEGRDTTEGITRPAPGVRLTHHSEPEAMPSATCLAYPFTSALISS